MDNQKNDLFNINKNLINNIIIYLDNNTIFNDEYTTNLKLTMNDLLSEDAKSYSSKYIKQFVSVFKKIMKNYKIFDLELNILDNREDDTRNNEYVLLSSIFNCKFIIKIISDEKNGKNECIVEHNCSKYISNNIILLDICPHFVLYINSMIIKENYFYNYYLNNSYNMALVYHYINPLKINIDDLNYKISNLTDFINYFNKYKYNYQQNFLDEVFLTIFFQIIYSICTLSKYRINHNDLRQSNILIHGNYIQNTYDTYKVINNGEETIYYVKNLGFKIKIIDFGLMNSDKIDILNNLNSYSHKMINEAGLFKFYSHYYDIHYVLNDILYNNKIKIISPNVHSLLNNIINEKYLGPYKVNKYVNNYWRLSIPYTIKEYSEIYNFPELYPEFKLNYDESNNLIIDDIIKTTMINHIEFLSKEKITNSILNNIIDPLDNNLDKILKPIEALKLFTHFTSVPKNSQIINNYILDLTY
jgi:hypothetical protein